ncbi:MAG: metallophosphoesterase, partial [Myxococcota bacterium]
MVRIVAISDTHNQHDALDVPDGDVLVHAGDMSGHGHLRELEAFAAWCEAQPHRHKVVIAGNHDFCFERAEECAQARQLLSSVHYLEDAAVEVAGLTFLWRCGCASHHAAKA